MQTTSTYLLSFLLVQIRPAQIAHFSSTSGAEPTLGEEIRAATVYILCQPTTQIIIPGTYGGGLEVESCLNVLYLRLSDPTPTLHKIFQSFLTAY